MIENLFNIFSVSKSDEKLDELAIYSQRLSSEVKRNSRKDRNSSTNSRTNPYAQRPAQPLPTEPSRPAPGPPRTPAPAFQPQFRPSANLSAGANQPNIESLKQKMNQNPNFVKRQNSAKDKKKVNFSKILQKNTLDSGN